MSRPRATSLRRRLMLLATVAVVPLAIACGLALLGLLRQQDAQAERAALDLARGLGAGVETQLRMTISALQALALVPDMAAPQEKDLASAHAIAREALRARPEWRALLLSRPDGQVIFNTNSPFGTRLGTAVDLPSALETSRLGTPTI